MEENVKNITFYLLYKRISFSVVHFFKMAAGLGGVDSSSAVCRSSLL